MRHRKDIKKLHRTASHRKALLANMATSLLEHKQIKTTTIKAKEVEKTVARLITFAKSGTLADRRQVLRTIRDKEIVKSLFDEIAPTFQNRNGGYTRVIKIGNRRGDGAELAILELVGFEGVQIEKQKSREVTKAKKEKQKEEKQKEEQNKDVE
ncbi:MAG: 50S ribosomal protein L17 [bacterium]